MDTKANLSASRKLNQLAVQHNKLTTLVACLLNEIGGLKKEIIELKGGDSSSHSTQVNQQSSRSGQVQAQQQSQGQKNPNKFPNFSELRAEDILKQLSINNSDN